MAGRKEIPREISIYINDVQVVNSFAGINRAIASTNNEIKNLNKNSETYDADLKKLQTTLGGLKEKQSEFKEEIAATSVSAGEAKEAFSKIFLGLTSGNLTLAKEGFDSIKGSIGGMVKSAVAFLATPLGAGIAVLATIGVATKEWFNYNESIRETTRLIENLSGKTGQVVADIRNNITGLSNTFGIEFEALAKAVDNLVDTGVAKDELEALEKIKNGLLTAPDKNEFIASLESSSLVAKQVGLDLETVIALKEEIESTGVDPEATFGALQKAVKNLSEQSDTLKTKMRDALGAGFADDVLAKVKSGEITINQALVAIGDKSKEIGLNQKQQIELTTSIFGKSGLAAGGLLTITEELTKAQENQTKGLTPLQESLKQVADSNVALAEAQDRALNSQAFENWKNRGLIAINKISIQWYKFIELVTTSEKQREDAKDKQLKSLSVDNYNKGLDAFFQKKKKEQGDSYDFQTTKELALQKLKQNIDAADAVNNTKKSERYRLLYQTLSEYTNKEKVLNTKKTADEIRESAEAAKKQADAYQKGLDKEKVAQEKHNKDLFDKALALAKAKGDLAKAELDNFIANNKAKLDGETILTDEIVAEETKRLSEVYNKKQVELEKEKQDKLNKAELEGKSAEEIAILKQTIELDYQTASINSYNEFLNSKAELDNRYLEQIKQNELEKLQAQNELDVLLAENKFDADALARKTAYNKEVADYKKKLADKLITDKQYKAAIDALDKKAKAEERVAELQKVQGTLGGLNQIAGAIGEMFGQSRGLAIAQAGINGAMAVTSILAQYPKFDGGFAMWAAIAASGITTIAQISKIQNAKAPTTPKFFYGGFDKASNTNGAGGNTGTTAHLGYDEFGKMTGVTHQDEWVAPAVMTQSPKYAATFAWLENERKSIVGNKYSIGGETTAGTLPQFIPGTSSNETAILEALNTLNAHLARGIKASTNIGYKEAKDIQKLNDERTEAENYGTVNK